MFKRLTIVLVAFFTVLLPSAATAADGYQKASKYTGNGNAYCTAHLYNSYNYDTRGCFRPHGDDILVVDGEADGYGVGVQWKTSSGRSGLCHWSGGKGTVGICYKNFPESSVVNWRVGICKKTSKVKCKAPKKYKGWSSWKAMSAGASNP